MKAIIKNKTNLQFLSKPIETLARDSNPQLQMHSREILTLYRDVLKMTMRFTWTNEEGEPWREILAKSARSEFELIRNETDPVKLGKFIITWKDAVMRIHEKVNDTQLKMMKHVDQSRTDKAGLDRNDYTGGGVKY